MADLSDPHPPPAQDRDHAQGKDAISGHPTARGPRDEYVPRMGSTAYGADGQPGVPRVRPGRYGITGTPSNTGRGAPRQDVIYETYGEPEDDDSF